MFFNIYLGQDQTAKLKDSFDNAPYATLLSDLRDTDEFGSFKNNTYDYTLYGNAEGGFPAFFYEQKQELYRLKGLRDSELKKLDAGGDELTKAQKAVDTAKQAVEDKKTEIDGKINGAKSE